MLFYTENVNNTTEYSQLPLERPQKKRTPRREFSTKMPKNVRHDWKSKYCLQFVHIYVYLMQHGAIILYVYPRGTEETTTYLVLIIVNFFFHFYFLFPQS